MRSTCGPSGGLAGSGAGGQGGLSRLCRGQDGGEGEKLIAQPGERGIGGPEGTAFGAGLSGHRGLSLGVSRRASGRQGAQLLQNGV